MDLSKASLERSAADSTATEELSTKELQRYLWRSLLTLFGPVLFFALYLFISVYYLANPPSNGIVTSSTIDAREFFYGWFMTAVLALDLARIGLSNIEAAALMELRLAPKTASQLMWHVDTNWSNYLWWLRYIRAAVLWGLGRRKQPAYEVARVVSIPGKLWAWLSLTSAILFISVSLSGLSMELQEVDAVADQKAPIFGPNSSSFGYHFTTNLPQRINLNWQSGRKVSPQSGAIFYAPEGAVNVSTTYFDDLAAQGALNIEVFTGPAVRQNVVGTAWGIYANISCRSTRAKDLKMIRTRELEVGRYSIRGCLLEPQDQLNIQDCHLEWLDTNNISTSGAWPTWINDSMLASGGDYITTSVVAVADGASAIRTEDTSSTNGDGGSSYYAYSRVEDPHCNVHGHDNWTFDSLQQSGSRNDRTVAAFELYLWQHEQDHPNYLFRPANATEIETLLSIWGPSADYAPPREDYTDTWDYLQFGSVGFGLHCDVDIAPGFAFLDPARRVFSRFNPVPADFVAGPFHDSRYQVSPAQVLAVGALASNQDHGTIVRPLERRRNLNTYSDNYVTTLLSMFNSLRLTGLAMPDGGSGIFPMLTAMELQQTGYKLLGETLVAMMGEIGRRPWYGELYSLSQTRYLVPGIVSWKPVLALLAIWTALISSGSIWLTFFAGPRWASGLNGFEMFKFGAQFTEEVSRFKGSDSQDCTESLINIPGMVGAVPGGSTHGDLVFIGLSEVQVAGSALKEKPIVKITFDRNKAAKTRQLQS